MRVIGITGGSGSGKTTICSALEAIGYTIIDADKIAREIVMPGKPALCEIATAFGDDMLNQDGTLNRKALAKIVFSSQEHLDILNAITHKYITACIQERIAQCTTQVCVIDAPLLYESKLDALCDVVIGITAERQTRIERIKQRDNLTDEEACTRINAQSSIERNLAWVDLCLDTTTNTPAAVLAQTIEDFIKGA